MSAATKIEWTDRTWNVVSGCTRVSPACDHCYIERTPPLRMAHRRFDKPGIGGTTGVELHPYRLQQPLTWRRPQRVFVCSLSDLFHDEVPDEFLVEVFDTMLNAHRHTFQVLTKRPARMRSFVRRYLAGDFAKRPLTDAPLAYTLDRPPPRIWLGVTVENQQWADARIPILLDTPAAVRFISAEPLLEPVDLSAHLEGLDWVITGGETGPGSRATHPDWFRTVRDQCGDADVAFHFKQHGDWVTEDQSPQDIVLPATSYHPLGDENPRFWRVGKKRAGRELDGRTWDQFPAVSA